MLLCYCPNKYSKQLQSLAAEPLMSLRPRLSHFHLNRVGAQTSPELSVEARLETTRRPAVLYFSAVVDDPVEPFRKARTEKLS